MNSRLESAFAWRWPLCATTIVLWLGAIGAGLGALAWYENSPAATEQPLTEWPGGSAIHRSQPRIDVGAVCPPTLPLHAGEPWRIEENRRPLPADRHSLDRVFQTRRSGRRLGANRPVACGQRDSRRPCHGRSGRRRGARFHVTTSGQTLLYSAAGELLFSGGITFARGHAGDNAGRTAIESYSAGDSPGYRQTPVFGCPIIATTEQK